MRVFFKRTDGGSETNVIGYWLIEWKSVFSIALLRFSEGSRENYHSHAFNAWSWIVSGKLREERLTIHDTYTAHKIQILKPSFKPVFTGRDNLHKVHGIAPVTWALTVRGPWTKTWTEYNLTNKETIILGHGRTIAK